MAPRDFETGILRVLPEVRPIGTKNGKTGAFPGGNRTRVNTVTNFNEKSLHDI